MSEIKLIENFMSFQGEGPDMGRPCLILRFKKCDRVENKKPCPWCDTIVRMRVSNEFKITLEEIQEQSKNLGILLTGGEPTFDDNFLSAVEIINNIDCQFINIETNGYQIERLFLKSQPKTKDFKIIYSPKFFNKSEYFSTLEQIENIQKQNYENVFVKLVVEAGDKLLNDQYNIDSFLMYLDSLNFDKRKIWLMPEGKNYEEIFESSKTMMDLAEKYKVNISTRLHISFGFL